MKKLLIPVLSLLILGSCTTDEKQLDTDSSFESTKKLLSIQEVNKYIKNQLETTGDVDWTNAPTNVLYSAVIHGNNVLSVGYGKLGESYAEVKSPELLAAKENAIEIARENEGGTDKIVMTDDALFNVIELKVAEYETIAQLQKADDIRYLQPIGYGFFQNQNAQQKSGSGCDQGNQNINRADYSVITPNAWMPWNYGIHNINSAWSQSTGAGVTVGLIDSGLSASQGLLGNRFTDGFSINSRTVEKYGTYTEAFWPWTNNPDGPNDRCGHGTSMAATIAAPRNDEFMPVGVAYDANLVSYRGTSDVLLDDYHERRGVSDALRALGNRGDVKIISMSIGYLWSIGNIRDAVRYAHSRGKLIIAAGGTSTSFTSWYGVIFPASMNETVAVTGIKDNGYVRCSNCHEGNKIDFTIVMQRGGTTDRNVPSFSMNNGGRKYVGGSSVATATTAGIAALIWSKYPNWSRAQVLNRLKQSGDLYPNPSNRFGYGNIDALQAVQ